MRPIKRFGFWVFLYVVSMLWACGGHSQSVAQGPDINPCGFGSPDPFCWCPPGSHRAQIGNYSDGSPIWSCVANP